MIPDLLERMFGALVLVVGILNLALVHPVPGMAYLLISSIFFPPVSNSLNRRLSYKTSLFCKILTGVFIIMFTLGVSDLGDMLD